MGYSPQVGKDGTAVEVGQNVGLDLRQQGASTIGADGRYDGRSESWSDTMVGSRGDTMAAGRYDTMAAGRYDTMTEERYGGMQARERDGTGVTSDALRSPKDDSSLSHGKTVASLHEVIVSPWVVLEWRQAGARAHTRQFGIKAIELRSPSLKQSPCGRTLSNWDLIGLMARRCEATRRRHGHIVREYLIRSLVGRHLHMSLMLDMGEFDIEGWRGPPVMLQGIDRVLTWSHETIRRWLMKQAVLLRVDTCASLLIRCSASPRKDGGKVDDEAMMVRLRDFVAGDWASFRALGLQQLTGARPGRQATGAIWCEELNGRKFVLKQARGGGSPSIEQALSAVQLTTAVHGLHGEGKLMAIPSYHLLLRGCVEDLILQLIRTLSDQHYDTIVGMGESHPLFSVCYPAGSRMKQRERLSRVCGNLRARAGDFYPMTDGWSRGHSWCWLVSQQVQNPPDVIVPRWPLAGELHQHLLDYDAFDTMWLLWLAQQHRAERGSWRAYIQMRAPCMTSRSREHSLMLCYLVGLLDSSLDLDLDESSLLWHDLVGACGLLPAHRRLGEGVAGCWSWESEVKDLDASEWGAALQRLRVHDEGCLRMLAFSFPHHWSRILWSYHSYRLHQPCTCQRVVGMCMMELTIPTPANE
jgi:hypothetical protein